MKLSAAEGRSGALDHSRRMMIACQRIETSSRTKCMIAGRRGADDFRPATKQATLFIVGPEDTTLCRPVAARR